MPRASVQKRPLKPKPVEPDQPLIIQYTNLLHAWDNENAPKVQEFLSANSNDEVFNRRAKVVNQLFKVKKAARD